MPYSNFSNVRYIIHDGARLGKGYYNEYPVLASDEPPTPGDDGIEDCKLVDNYIRGELSPGTLTMIAELYWVNDYGTWSGFLGLNQSTSVFNDTTWLRSAVNSSSAPNPIGLSILNRTPVSLDGPVLNITGHFAADISVSDAQSSNHFWDSVMSFDSPVPRCVWPIAYSWKDPRTEKHIFGDKVDPRFYYENKTFTLEQLNARGNCQQVGFT